MNIVDLNSPELPGHGLERPAGVPPVLEQGGGVDPVHQPLDRLRGADRGLAALRAHQHAPQDLHGVLRDYPVIYLY